MMSPAIQPSSAAPSAMTTGKRAMTRSIRTLPKMTIGMLIARPSERSVYFIGARSGVGAAALAAAATAAF